MSIRVAVTGYSRVGKDSVGTILQSFGFHRIAMGDLIKTQLDPIIKQYLGFSAFTEVDEEKELIRTTLESWGYANYAANLEAIMANLPPYAVNTRLFRCEEAERWKAIGGFIWHVTREGCKPHTPKEREETQRMWKANLIDSVVTNNGTLDDLRQNVARALEGLV